MNNTKKKKILTLLKSVDKVFKNEIINIKNVVCKRNVK